MAHLDVVPVEGTWQHDAFGGDGRRRPDLGPRHPRRQGLPGRRSARRSRPARAGLHAGAGRLALVRLRRGGVRYGGRAGRRRARAPRRAAVVRRRRGRRDRPRRVHRRRQAGRRRRRDREGDHVDPAAGRGPRRPRLDPGADGPDRAAGPGDHPARPLADAGQPAGADASSCSGGSRRTRRSPLRPLLANAGRLGPALARGCSPRSARRARRWCARRSRSPRSRAARRST